MVLTFLDADVLIDLARRRPKTMDLLSRLQDEGASFAVASINVAEVLRGAQPPDPNYAVVAALLQALTEVPAGPRVARRYAQVMHVLDRAGRRIPELDGLVAATVLSEGGRLVTGNRRHFDRVAGLDVIVARKG
jgi:predicted nucleic acid-binding protein